MDASGKKFKKVEESISPSTSYVSAWRQAGCALPEEWRVLGDVESSRVFWKVDNVPLRKVEDRARVGAVGQEQADGTAVLVLPRLTGAI